MRKRNRSRGWNHNYKAIHPPGDHILHCRFHGGYEGKNQPFRESLTGTGVAPVNGYGIFCRGPASPSANTGCLIPTLGLGRFTTCPSAEGSVYPKIDGFTNEAYTTISEQEIAPTRMKTGESMRMFARVVQRLLSISHDR